MDQYLIFNYDARPKRLHIKLNKLKRNKKFEFDYMPTLKQIQDFINNRKKKIGDENNLDELKTFVDGLKYSEGITKDDFGFRRALWRWQRYGTFSARSYKQKNDVLSRIKRHVSY